MVIYVCYGVDMTFWYAIGGYDIFVCHGVAMFSLYIEEGPCSQYMLWRGNVLLYVMEGRCSFKCDINY